MKINVFTAGYVKNSSQAISMKQEKMDREIKVDENKCVYCLVCKRACPVNAIKAVCSSCSYGDYRLNPEDAKIKGRSITQDECVNCGWCQEICQWMQLKS